jgi:hypothetical protein
VCLVRLEHLAEELRPEIGDRRAHWDAGADPAERQVFSREAGRRERDPEVGGALPRRARWIARVGDSRDVALHVGEEDGDSRGGKLLGEALQRAGLPGAGRACDQAVPVHHLERHLDDRLVHERPVVDALTELDRRSLGRVRLRDRLGEVGHRGPV